MIKIILISVMLTFIIVVWACVQNDYNEFRAKDREAGYALPDWSYWEAVVKAVKRVFRIK